MTETELQDLWKRLMTEKAELPERQAVANACDNITESRELSTRQGRVEYALHSLKEARSIRELLAKVEAVGDVTGLKRQD